MTFDTKSRRCDLRRRRGRRTTSPSDSPMSLSEGAGGLGFGGFSRSSGCRI